MIGTPGWMMVVFGLLMVHQGVCEDTYLRITATGTISELFIDGTNVQLKENAMKPYSSDMYRLSSRPSAVAVKVENTNVLSAFLLADIVEDGVVISTTDSLAWLCTSKPHDDKGWTRENYREKKKDDWYSPIEFATNGDQSISGIDAGAAWVAPGLGLKEIWCRYRDDRTSLTLSEVTSVGAAIQQWSTNPCLASPLYDSVLSKDILADSLFVPTFMRALEYDSELENLAALIKASLDALRPSFLSAIQPDDVFPLPSMTMGACVWPEYDCSAQGQSRYRSADSSCNNLQHPLWGRSATPFARDLSPDYGDGKGTLRRQKNGEPLPNPRSLSWRVSEDKSRPHALVTQAVMVFGQFLDHDIDLTPVTSSFKSPEMYGRLTDIKCGDDGCSQTHPACSPIIMPVDDPSFTKPCLGFLRSLPMPDLQCSDVREQLNLVTSFIDGSQVYGSNKAEMDFLRDMSDSGRGRMRATPHPFKPTLKELLPEADTGCEEHNSTHKCFKAGDVRANEHHGLTIFHTIFMREHNRLESLLHDLNPHWDGEQLFQEARRIVGAELQLITYREFLPAILGPDMMDSAGLRVQGSGYFTGYTATVDPSIVNSFSTSTFRYGHSTISNVMKRADHTWKLGTYPDFSISEQFFRPAELYNIDEEGIDAFLRGIVEQRSEKCDRFMPSQVTVNLFTQHPPSGQGNDLLSLNIKRGRDHGLPGYNDYREICGLSRAADFNDLGDIKDQEARDAFALLYDDVDDIDLFLAGISETPVHGGMVGPTFACLIAEQFRKLKIGDRFYFENDDETAAFSPSQLSEIGQVSLGRVLCDNSDNIQTMQPEAIMVPFREAYPNRAFASYEEADHGLGKADWNAKWDANFNARVSCASLPGLDINQWQD